MNRFIESRDRGKSRPGAVGRERVAGWPATPPRHSYAFQPIVDIATGSVFSYEALLRGPDNEPAGAILGSMSDAEIHALDETGRQRALELASALGVPEESLGFKAHSLGAITGWSYADGADATYEVTVGVLEVGCALGAHADQA